MFPLQKNSNQMRSFWSEFLASLRECCHLRVSSQAVKVCKNKQLTGKIQIRDSKECKQQAIKFDLKKSKSRFMWLRRLPAFAISIQRCRIHWFYIKVIAAKSNILKKQIGFSHGNLYNLRFLSNSSSAKTWLSTRNRIFSSTSIDTPPL